MNAGDTFLVPLPETTHDAHLWMVISDPTQGSECVIVNFTSWRKDKDQACILDGSDHPYIAKKTCVNFKDAKKCGTDDLKQLIANRQLNTHTPLSPELLEKIRSAVPNSRMNWECVELLVAQGLCSID